MSVGGSLNPIKRPLLLYYIYIYICFDTVRRRKGEIIIIVITILAPITYIYIAYICYNVIVVVID